MAYTAVPSVVTGQTYPAASYNTYIKDNFAALWVYTTQGDIAYATGANALARLGISAANSLMRSTGSALAWFAPGAALQHLRMNASATALEWAAVSGGVTNRQGGNATDWNTPGTTNYTPPAVRIQAGSVSASVTGSPAFGWTTITFPVAFAAKPLIFLNAGWFGTGPVSGLLELVSNNILTTAFDLGAGYNSNSAAWGNPTVHWLAIGAA